MVTVHRLIDVLLIEDDPNDADLVMRVLNKSKPNGYRVDHVSDGSKAVDYLSTQPRVGAGLPRLILLDLKLPKLDGFEILKRIRSSKEWSNVPVVVLSSSSIDADVERSYDLGANAYVVKPIRYPVYKNAIESIARFWLETIS